MTDGVAPESFEEGRYLFCVVGTDDAAPSFETDGLAGETAYLVATDGVGAVVQHCDQVFDSDDPETVRRWLLSHQEVVDAAGEAFGTPLPVRFDTIIKGGDAGIREWLDTERATLEAALETVAGQWEYRIELIDDQPSTAEELEATDEQLQELAAERDAASEGAAYLKDKQYDRRLQELRQQRLADRVAAIEDAVAELASDVRRVESQPAGGALGGTDDGPRLTVLAPRRVEEDIGAVLESIAAEDDFEVRYTGPWPPYSFVPSFGGEQ